MVRGTSSSLFAAAAQPGRFRTVVVGSGGAAVPLELTGVLKDWVVDLIPGAGHFCWEEKAAEYAALVADWWANPKAV